MPCSIFDFLTVVHDHLRLTTNRLLLNTRMVCFFIDYRGARIYYLWFLLNVSYYYASPYAIENRYRALHLPVRHVSAMIRGFLCA